MNEQDIRDIGDLINKDRDCTRSLRRTISERLFQHRENLKLWQGGYLNFTEPDELEREAVKRELKAAIAELENMERIIQ